MRHVRVLRVLALFWLCLTLPAFAAKGRVTDVSGHEICVTDVSGHPVAPLTDHGQKATVLYFITNDCPIANSYAPEISRIQTAYASRGIAFYLVYVDPALAPADAKKHLQAYRYTLPGLMDTKHSLVALAHATVTPEAAVFTPDGKLRYHGRIDDRAVGFGKVRSVASRHDLRETLDSLLDGKPIPRASIPAVGCFIADLKK